MSKELTNDKWRLEEQSAHINGWNFSHIDGRYAEDDDLTWY